MPYIEQKTRDYLNELRGPGLHAMLDAGGLNYLITRLVLDYMDGQESYALYNEVVGVLECVKQELYRRLISNYEDKKIELNGDVYP